MSEAIMGFTPRSATSAATSFAKEVVAAAAPETSHRAKAFLFAASRLGAFGEAVDLDLVPAVLLHPSVIERFVRLGCKDVSPATRRTLRNKLRAVARALDARPGPASLSRERSKLPYTQVQIANYLALCDAQPTVARRQRASALVCLSGGRARWRRPQGRAGHRRRGARRRRRGRGHLRAQAAPRPVPLLLPRAPGGSGPLGRRSAARRGHITCAQERDDAAHCIACGR
ncbi:MAG: hypothetical protein ACRDYZ_15650 [Acidimicrobiales bacterium]